MENKDKFIQELHDILEKYNVEISIGLDGDTHGLASWIEISHRVNSSSFKYESILTLDDLTAYDLKKHIS